MIYFVSFTSKVCDEVCDRWHVKLLERRVSICSMPQQYLLFMPRLVRVMNYLSIDDLFRLFHFQSLWWRIDLMVYGIFEAESTFVRPAAIPVIHASARAGYEWFIQRWFILFPLLQSWRWGLGLVTYGVFGTESKYLPLGRRDTCNLCLASCVLWMIYRYMIYFVCFTSKVCDEA